MVRSRRLLSSIVLASVLAGCARPTAPVERSAIVTVQAETIGAAVVAGGSGTWIQFTVPLRIENTGSTPLAFALCASRIEARTGDLWSAAWTPICALHSSDSADVPSGEHRDFSVVVSASVDASGGPQWHGTGITGAYRFVAGVTFAGTTGIVPTVTSNQFTLTESLATADQREHVPPG